MLSTCSIRKLPSNSSGKDYVVGDLHGCFELLEKLLVAVSFDKTKDRLFSVGDLIDRGPDSLRCLELLFEPWFYAVQGNHELMMLDFFVPYLNTGKLERFEDLEDTGFLEYGGQWVKNYFDPEQQMMTSAFNRCLLEIFKMPLILLVGEGEHRFHVIHAELVKPDYRQSGQIAWLDSDIDGWLEYQEIPLEVEDRLYWGRTLMTVIGNDHDCPKILEGLSPTFCGHTFDKAPRKLYSHINIDTGGFMSFNGYAEFDKGYGLTLYDVHESHWVSVAYEQGIANANV